MDALELWYMPATESVTAIEAKRVSAVEPVLAQIERLKPTLNAHCATTGCTYHGKRDRGRGDVARFSESTLRGTAVDY